jgi:hypothetical protein
MGIPLFSTRPVCAEGAATDWTEFAMRKNEKQQAVDALQVLLRKHGLQVADIESPEQASRIGWRILSLLTESEVTQ